VSVTAEQAGPAVASPASAEAPPAVVVSDVSKSFRRPHHQVSTLKERVLHPLRRIPEERLAALKEVSLEVGRGEFFGIVGRNGSGKSTLLKCLAGIYRTSSGKIRVNGRLSPFIELGVGFNPDLNAYDNVVINATLLGLSPMEARRRFNEIIEFAELEDFANLKLKNYSSGMHVRLAFAVAIQLDAEILLIDEVLAVGDAAFQNKCMEAFHDIKRSGRTVLFVTHDMSLVQQFCDRAMLLEGGRVQMIGNPTAVAARYNEVCFGIAGAPKAGDVDEARWGDGTAEILDGWFEDSSGRRVEVLRHGERCRFRARVAFHRAIENPGFNFHLRNALLHDVFKANTQFLGPDGEPVTQPLGEVAAGTELAVSFQFENLLAMGAYLASFVVHHDGGRPVADWREHFRAFRVDSHYPSEGVVDLPHQIEIEQAG
jgi:ABC-type polysaccharide/polyol phosphate transport system ATPase subunit